MATRQHGLISRAQLRAIGLSDAAIASRVASGGLQGLVRGVFAVGHRATGRHAVMLAAAMACGEGTVVSHGSAAELLGLRDRRSVSIDVIAPGRAGRRIEGVKRHDGYPVPPDEVGVCDGIPCTSPSRTLVDLAGQLSERSLRRLVEQAAVLRLLDIPGIDRSLARRRRRGAPMLRRVIAPWRGEGERPRRLRSRTEAQLFAAVAEAGFPRPRCNVKLEIDTRQLEVDLLWEEQRLVVETDGEETHGTPAAFQHDRWRDQLLTAAGYRTVRITWHQLQHERAAVLERLGRMLRAAAR